MKTITTALVLAAILIAPFAFPPLEVEHLRHGPGCIAFAGGYHIATWQVGRDGQCWVLGLVAS